MDAYNSSHQLDLYRQHTGKKYIIILKVRPFLVIIKICILRDVIWISQGLSKASAEFVQLMWD